METVANSNLPEEEKEKVSRSQTTKKFLSKRKQSEINSNQKICGALKKLSQVDKAKIKKFAK